MGLQTTSDSMLSGRLNTGRGSNSNIFGNPTNLEHDSSPLNSEIPLLTYGEEVSLQIVLLIFLWFSFNSMCITAHK